MAPGSAALAAALALRWQAAAAAPLDLRVAKGARERGYAAVRVSVVDRGEAEGDPFFDYSGQFFGAWQEFHLHSAVKQVEGDATFTIGGQSFKIHLPQEGERVRGLLFADPCISSLGGMNCPWQDAFHTQDRLATILSQFLGSDEIDFWGIVGDNFYESNAAGGHVSKGFFESLSLQAKSKPLLAVPGNHDFWIAGGPPGQEGGDQFGYGFMQMYGQDTRSSLLPGHAPYDFSVPPQPGNLPIQENFVFSHQIGDAAFFGYSGAHRQDQLAPHLEGFCRWLEGASSVNTAVLLGHWNVQNLGCQGGMATPSVYEAARAMPGCNSKNLIFVDGHEHCNRVHVNYPDHGFLIGGNGMGGDCGRQQFGFLVLESDPHAENGPNVRVDYFELASMSNKDYVLTSTGELDAVRAALGWSNQISEDVALDRGGVFKGVIESYTVGLPDGRSAAPVTVRGPADLPPTVVPGGDLTINTKDIQSNWDALQECIQSNPGRPYTACRERFAEQWRGAGPTPTTTADPGRGELSGQIRFQALRDEPVDEPVDQLGRDESSGASSRERFAPPVTTDGSSVSWQLFWALALAAFFVMLLAGCTTAWHSDSRDDAPENTEATQRSLKASGSEGERSWFFWQDPRDDTSENAERLLQASRSEGQRSWFSW